MFGPCSALFVQPSRTTWQQPPPPPAVPPIPPPPPPNTFGPTEGQNEQWREANRRRQRQTIRYRGLVPTPPPPPAKFGQIAGGGGVASGPVVVAPPPPRGWFPTLACGPCPLVHGTYQQINQSIFWDIWSANSKGKGAYQPRYRAHRLLSPPLLR